MSASNIAYGPCQFALKPRSESGWRLSIDRVVAQWVEQAVTPRLNTAGMVDGLEDVLPHQRFARGLHISFIPADRWSNLTN